MAKNEIQTIEVVCDRVYHKKKRTFYIQLEKGETETEIAMADTENEDRIELPVDDVEHGQRGTDSRTSGSKKMKIRIIFKYLKVRRTTLRIFSQGQVNGVL